MTGSFDETRADRDQRIQDFLHQAGWGDAVRAPLAGDASSRRYERIRHKDAVAVLMDAPPAAESAACPPNATPEQRAALGYNAMARLAGPNVRAFAALADWLRAQGLSAPMVFAADFDAGLLLLEDLGDAVYSRAITDGAPEKTLYRAAIDALATLHAAPPPVDVNGYSILTYDDEAALAETSLFLDWYIARHTSGGAVSDSARADWDSAWRVALARARPQKPVLTLRDYHADNLIWMPQRSGPARAGLLDFQDALAGHPAYDIASLLEDARRDVNPNLASEMIDAWLAQTGEDEALFREAYSVWAGQRNAKILGIFVRLSARDGKPRYLDLLPRVESLFTNDIAHPALAEVRDWIGRHAPGLLTVAA